MKRNKMKIKLFAVLALLLIGAGSSFAYEQKLQYPNTSASVIGMQFVSNPDGSLSVQGNVSYRTKSCSRYRCVYTDHNFIGTWDALGHLTSQVDGALPPQTALFVNGIIAVQFAARSARNYQTVGASTAAVIDAQCTVVGD